MEPLDQVDLAILRHLLVDARRPYSDIADSVDLSPPTVSERTSRLQQLGVIERFTLDLDWSTLTDGIPVLLDLDVRPTAVDDVRRALENEPGVEQVFVTAESCVVARANLPRESVHEIVSTLVEEDAVRAYDVRLLVEAYRTTTLPSDVSVTLECDECGTRTTGGGKSLQVDEGLYKFCCAACKRRFEERYRRLADGS